MNLQRGRLAGPCAGRARVAPNGSGLLARSPLHWGGMTEKAKGKGAVRALIVDDEKLAREELAFQLKSLPVKIVGTAANGLEALEAIEKHKPDLVFLDVQMPGLDGLGVVRRLVEGGGRIPYIVFATAYDQYAVKAFEVNAVDYLLKPIEKKRLKVAVERARRLIDSPEQDTARIGEIVSQLRLGLQRPAKVLLKSHKHLFLVDAGEVVFATIQDGLITIVSSKIEGMSNYRTLEDLESSLDLTSFWRVHRSYLVNIDKIQEVVPWFKSSYHLRMSDRKQTEIPVSRAQTKRLRELFKL